MSKSYVGNVGYVGYGLKSVRLHTACAMTGSYCHYDNENKSSLGSVKITANIANKKQKVASRLGFDVGVFTQKNSQQIANMGDKLASKINAKESLTLQNNLLQWFSATQ